MNLRLADCPYCVNYPYQENFMCASLEIKKVAPQPPFLFHSVSISFIASFSLCFSSLWMMYVSGLGIRFSIGTPAS